MRVFPRIFGERDNGSVLLSRKGKSHEILHHSFNPPRRCLLYTSIPKDKRIERPDLLHVQRLAALVVVEQLHQLACHEEFLRNIALERRLDLVVVLILTQPIVQRNREAELLFVRGTLRQLLDSRAAQGDLRCV